MNNSIMRLPQVKLKTGLSRSAIYQRISDNKFPRQVNLGGRAVGWLESEVQNWIKQRLAASRMGGQL
jgi:prophage regulatory protein